MTTTKETTMTTTSKKWMGNGRPLHLGTIYVWDKVSDERFAKFREDVLDGLIKLVKEVRDELDAEIETEATEETVSEPLPKSKKRKEKMS
jgi:hypothetical protein